MRWIALVVAAVVSSGVARAELLQAPNRIGFVLPNLGTPWDQEWAKGVAPGEVKIASDTVGNLPELVMCAFAPSKDGSLDDIEARLATEVKRPGVAFFGEKVKTFAVSGKATTEKIKDVTVRYGTATVNDQPAGFAIAQHNGKSVILIGVTQRGIAQRGLSNFTATVKGVWIDPGRKQAPPEPAPADDDKPYVPTLQAFAVLKDATATSTFVDKSKRDLYGAWRTVVFDTNEHGIPKTAWCEGKPDEGIGEGITLTFASPVTIATLDIAAGVWLTEKLFKANNRITKLSVRLDGGAPIAVKPVPEREWTSVKVNKAVTTITVAIDGVTKGKMNDSCISAVRLLGGTDGDLPVLRGIEPAAAAALPAAVKSIYAAIGNDKELEKLIGFPFSLNDSSVWGFGDEKTFKYTSWKSVAAACKAERKKELDEGTPRRCPGSPYVRDDGGAASVRSGGPNTVIVRFPSGREVSDIWTLKWSGGAWKLHAIDFES